MGPSLRFFKLFGVEVRIHPTFFLLPLFLAIFYGAHYGMWVGVRVLALVMMVFASVLGHEFSHSLVAGRFGIPVPYITLYPIGGVASMRRIPREPNQEFLISIAGPLFNFALALILFGPLYFLIGKKALFSPTLETWPGTIANFFWINPMLGFFNLLPAFPMDGGRILRSILSRHTNYLKATQISAYLGRIFAIIFLLLGIWKWHWMLGVIALFVYVSASNEERQVRYEERLRQKLGENDRPSA